jgi:hypothetical protein
MVNIMLDWSKIDNYYILQRLVNHLFALECNSPGFIPSSPYIGADGAWDGSYRGYYDYEKRDGLWSIQSKWTKKSGKSAFDHLKKEIRKELQKANRKNADHLRIATNAELTVDYVTELQELNTGKVATLRIWDREELERRIELQPYLRYRFFGFPQYPKFVPSNEYFSKTEEHLLPIFALEIPRFNSYIKEVKLFILSENQHILLIHSPGGYGKSHLLRETAFITHQTNHERQTWMIWAGRREILNAFQDEIVEGRKYLLIFDDADRSLEEIKSLLSIIRSKGGYIKVILALRTSGFESIYDRIRELRLEGCYDEMEISEWSKDDLIRLLRLAAGKEKIEDEETIVALYSNPYLIVQIGRNIRKDSSVDFRKIKEKIVNEMFFEAKICSKDIFHPFELEDFLTCLSCLIPFSRGDRVFKFLSTQFNGKVEKVILSLKKAGIIRMIGNSFRFNPDMKGDLYLARQLEKAEPEEVEGLMEELLPVSPERLFTNLEAAAGYSETITLKEPLSRIVCSWIEAAENTSAYLKASRLNLIGKITYLVPEDTLMLLHAYLDTENSLTTDDYGPAIRKLMNIASMRRDVVEVTEKIGLKGMIEHYYSYKPTSLIEYAVSPLYNDSDVILKTLDIFLEWLKKPNDLRVVLISTGLSEVLAGSHDYTKSTIGGMTFGTKMLKNVPRICKIRNKALQILIAMIDHPSLEVELAAIGVAGNIGKGNLGDMPIEKIPLSGKIAEEREIVLEKIGNHISPEVDFQLLDAIENLLLDWWAMEKPGTEKAENYLRTFPRSIEYIVFRHFVSSRYAFEDFCLLEKQAPTEDRWRWFVHISLDKLVYPKLEDFQSLVESLRGKYNDEMKIIEFLKYMDDKLSPCDSTQGPPIVSCWVNLESELFFSLRNCVEFRQQIPERFRDEIDFALADLNEGFTFTLAGEVLSGLPATPLPKIINFLKVLMRHPIPDAALEVWLSELLERGNTEIRNEVIRHIDFIFGRNQNYDTFFELLSLAISKEDILGRSILESLSLIFHNPSKELEFFEGKSKESFRKELLCKLKDVSVYNLHSEEIWRFVFDGIESVIDLIEYRLQKFIEIREKHIADQEYEIIPFENTGCVTHQFRSYEDFEKFMGKVLEWHDRDMLRIRHELDHLMENVRSVKDRDSRKSYLEEYINKQLERNNIKDAIIISRFLTFCENTLDQLISVINKAASTEELKEVEELLDHEIGLGRAWVSRPDEPPLELVEKRNLYEKILENMQSGKTTLLVRKSIERIDMLIDVQMKLSEDVSYLRG